MPDILRSFQEIVEWVDPWSLGVDRHLMRDHLKQGWNVSCLYQSWSFSAAQHSAEELSCPRPRLAVFHTLAMNWPNSCMTPQSTPISSRQSRGDGLHATVAGQRSARATGSPRASRFPDTT